MAFRFKLDEPIEKGFCRIGSEQIERALELEKQSESRAVAVHETRKCMKRIRALLRLVRPGLGDDVFRVENARFRDIAARMSSARDSQVLLETVLKLEMAATASAEEFLEALRETLQRELRNKEAISAEEDSRVEEAADLLSAAAREFERLSLEPSGFSVVERGLEASYRRGRHAFAAAYDEGTDEAFHELRKSVQLHWRHMQLLSRAWPEMVEARVGAARRLSQILGEDHDLSLLVAYLGGPSVAHLSEGEALELSLIARARQKALRADSYPRAEQLFATGASAFSSSMAVVWKAARKIASAGPQPDDSIGPAVTAGIGAKRQH